MVEANLEVVLVILQLPTPMAAAAEVQAQLLPNPLPMEVREKPCQRNPWGLRCPQLQNIIITAATVQALRAMAQEAVEVQEAVAQVVQLPWAAQVGLEKAFH
jgi:hypothetical protein